MVDEALDEILQQLENAEKEGNQFLDEDMEELINSEVIPEIQAVARAANLPDAFIDNIFFVKTDENRGKIINTWQKDGKPLARWFNDGTKDHFIAPVTKLALHWISLLGNDAFSKGHMVRGLPKTEAMEIGLFLGEKRLKREVSIRASERFRQR